jgi:hypothetical protein
MTALRSSRRSPGSSAVEAEAPTRKPAGMPAQSRGPVAGVAVLLSVVSAAAVAYCLNRGWTLWYGDAQAHLDIARRIVDSRTPGYEQFGTVWLPLPHLLMLPFVGNLEWWHNGLAGAIPAAVCFVLGGVFLFCSVRRVFSSEAAAWCAAFVYALNPNLLYLQSTPMTEPVSLACLLGLLYFSVRFRDSQSLWDVALAGACALAGTLTRYEGWFVVPLAAVYFLVAASSRRVLAGTLFSLIAALGPLSWLAHNWYYYSNALEFYNGFYSAKQIYQRALNMGLDRYPGDGEWKKAILYYRTAAAMCLGSPACWIGIAGCAVALFRRAWWPLLLLVSVPVFYVWSIYSAGTPIFVPQLWPHSYYNIRYGVNAMPLLAFGIAAIVSLAPGRTQVVAAALVVIAAIVPWLANPRPEAWICWKESQVNSSGRRAWTRAAAEYLGPRYHPGAGIFLSFGDLTGILREAKIPLREAMHEGNGLRWVAATARPDFFLREEWAIAVSGDQVSTTMLKTRRGVPRFECVRTYAFKNSPVIEIYRRIQ